MVENNSFYRISLEINPKKQFISVDMTLSYPLLQGEVNRISFMLNKNLKIKEINGAKVSDTNFDCESPQFLPEAGELIVELSEVASEGEVIEMKLSYEGNLGIFQPYGDNRLTEEWIELGLYFPWFPINLEQINNSNITSSVVVKIDKEYKVFGMGTTKQEDNYWHIKNDTPSNDIIIMGSKNIKEDVIEKDGEKIRIFYDINNAIISSHGLWVLEKYKQWFGPTKDGDISIVFAPGGAYARRNFIVLRNNNLDDNNYNEIDYFVTILGHEFAHLWWAKSPTDSWESWLDEGFAEYSALRVLRERFGEPEFQKALEIRKRRIINTPPIKNLDMSFDQVKTVTYDKGCILLHTLESKVGEKIFLEILRLTYKNNINTTEKFLNIVSELAGIEVSNEFSELIDRY